MTQLLVCFRKFANLPNKNETKVIQQIHARTNNYTVTFTCTADACPTLGAALGREAVVAETDAFHCNINP